MLPIFHWHVRVDKRSARALLWITLFEGKKLFDAILLVRSLIRCRIFEWVGRKLR